MNKKIIIITGASRGIGKALAIKFLEKGHAVIGISRTKPDIDDVHWIKADITSSSDRKKIKEEVLHNFKRIDVLINNAGIGMYNLWENTDSEDLKHIFEVNFFSLVELTKLIIPELKKTQGTVINTSSVAGRFHVACMGAYCATKYALNAFSDSLRVELKPFNIHVLNLLPGRINTGFSKYALGDKKPPPSPGAKKAEDFAKQVYKAYIHKKRELIFPVFYKIFMLFIKIFPNIYDYFNIKKWKL